MNKNPPTSICKTKFKKNFRLAIARHGTHSSENHHWASPHSDSFPGPHLGYHWGRVRTDLCQPSTFLLGQHFWFGRCSTQSCQARLFCLGQQENCLLAMESSKVIGQRASSVEFLCLELDDRPNQNFLLGQEQLEMLAQEFSPSYGSDATLVFSLVNRE